MRAVSVRGHTHGAFAARGKTNNRFFNDALAQALYVGAARDTATCREGFGDTARRTCGNGRWWASPPRRGIEARARRRSSSPPRRGHLRCGPPAGWRSEPPRGDLRGRRRPARPLLWSGARDGTDQRADRGRSHDCLHCVRPDGASASLESAGAVTLPRHEVLNVSGWQGPFPRQRSGTAFQCDDGHKIQIKLLEKRNDSCPPQIMF